MAVVEQERTTQATGLSSQEAQRRLEQYGRNEIEQEKGPSPLKEFAKNLVQPLALLLWACAVLALLADEPMLSVAIACVVVINAVFSFAEEYKAEKAVDELQEMLPEKVRARRDGEPTELDSEEVVPGDVLLLGEGDKVAADGDLVSASDLRVDESALTGESTPVTPDEHVYAGTYVTRGTAEALVTQTGMDTRFGGIASMTQSTEREQSPLETELNRVVYMIGAAAAALGIVFFIFAGATGTMSLHDRFVFAIGVTVSLVPNGLLPTTTLSLALATQRMARRKTIVRRLSSVETLGETTVICTDKTGTLTKNEMTVQQIWTPDGTSYDVDGTGYGPYGRFRRDEEVVDPTPLTDVLRTGMLCNDAHLVQGDGWSVIGDPTEGALIVVAEKAGLNEKQETARAPRLFELPFTSERKRMTTVHLVDDRRVAYAKGAAEMILPLTTLSREEQEQVRAAEEAMENQALRVLAYARRVGVPEEAGEDPGAVEQQFEFQGLVGMIDPPREHVPDAIARCHTAGIRVIMVTGDSPRTAEAIARRVGIIDGDGHVITGPELASIDDDELKRRLADRQVIFARIDPDQKLRLAKALHEQAEIVAMTGDGVNDAPALKQADIGVAMGSGTDVAKQAADMVLLDDDFASIVAAVEEGRAVYDNMRRFIGYHFSANMAELTTYLVWGLSGGIVPLPLVVMQILAIDLFTDLLPAMALGSERPEPGTMSRSPRSQSDHLLNRATFMRIAFKVGPLVSLAAMSSFFFAYALAGWHPWQHMVGHGSLYVEATTMTMAGIVFAQIGSAQSWRTNRESVRTIGLFSNRLLNIGIAVQIVIVVLLAYVPFLQDVFTTGPLSGWEWLWLAAWPAIVLGAEEARKAIARRKSDERLHPITQSA
jgi:magnesium-transporting ATPase (P-type)